jgi:hypothetical protein
MWRRRRGRASDSRATPHITEVDKIADRYEAGLRLTSLILWVNEPAQNPLLGKA